MERMPSSVTARALHPTEDFPPAQEQVVSSITSRASGPQHSFRAYSDDIKEDEVQAVVSEVVAAQPLEEVAVTVVISDINTSQGENDETISHAIEPAAGITPETPEASLPMPEVPTERPKSPWTPSYSVTVQGPGAEAEADVEELEQLPPTTVQVHAVDIVTEVMTTADVPVIRTDDEDEALIVSQADTVSMII
ncbi:hypothetical protein OBBRIDRAFT_145465 [Obba rivulosa]|uniref:Uncharacterized protein n=1 Tax=Obba rivulosa TaxID=1052685 RepID=A0A8E2J484_9APHY|nr:hypothetical protein OBBRIDRAFT_145465 [Obba rivulosa]